jgi:hypothetical protein
MKKLGDPIYFSDFRFHAGVNMTVRRGVEWDLAPKGQYLARHPWEDRDSFPVKVFETRVIRFDDIPETWLNLLNFSGGDINLTSLQAQLEIVYPHFNAVEIVTCVFFKVEKRENGKLAEPKRRTYHRDQKADPEKKVEKEKA